MLNNNIMVIIFIIITLVAVISILITTTSIFSKKRRKDFFGNSIKMMNDIYKENEKDIREINRMNAEMKAESIRLGTSAFKKGLKEDYMYCKYCKEVIDIDSKYCKKCGKEL